MCQMLIECGKKKGIQLTPVFIMTLRTDPQVFKFRWEIVVVQVLIWIFYEYGLAIFTYDIMITVTVPLVINGSS